MKETCSRRRLTTTTLSSQPLARPELLSPLLPSSRHHSHHRQHHHRDHVIVHTCPTRAPHRRDSVRQTFPLLPPQVPAYARPLSSRSEYAAYRALPARATCSRTRVQCGNASQCMTPQAGCPFTDHRCIGQPLKKGAPSSQHDNASPPPPSAIHAVHTHLEQQVTQDLLVSRSAVTRTCPNASRGPYVTKSTRTPVHGWKSSASVQMDRPVLPH